MSIIVRRLLSLANRARPIISCRRYSASPSDSEFKVVYPIRDIHYVPTLDHLKKNFFQDETLNRAAGADKETLGHELLLKYCLDTLDQGLSVMLVHNASSDIAGVCLNAILKEGTLEKQLQHLSKVNDEKYKQVFSKIIELNLSCNLYKKYQVNEIFECRILSVDKNYRGKGLAGVLVQLSELIGRSKGSQFMKADLTGAFSQKIFAKQGHKVVLEKSYHEIKDQHGNLIIPAQAPNHSIQISIKQLH